MIREDNATLDTLFEDLINDKISIKEYITRSEGGSHIFTTLLNKKLLTAYQTTPVTYTQFVDVVQSDGKDIRFPALDGVNPAYVPELSEIPFTQTDITSVTVIPEKFGMRVGISQEMIDDNEVNLMGWHVTRAGVKMRELEDQETYKAIHTFHGTGAAGDASVSTYMGNYDRGKYYTTSTCTLTLSGTALGWEALMTTAINILQTRTISLLGETFRSPVYPDTIVCNTVNAIPLYKLLNATLVVNASGVVDPTGSLGAAQLAGNNMWKGMLNVIASPFAPVKNSWLCKGKRSFVFVQRHTPKIDKNANWAYDAQEIRALSRFMPAVVEQAGWLPIAHV